MAAPSASRATDPYVAEYRADAPAQVMNLVAVEQYDQALELARQIARSKPDSPLGWFMMASVLQARTIDYEDDLDLPALTQACDSVLAKCRLLSNQSPAMTSFYGGAVHGYQAFQEFRKGGLWRAYQLALKSAAELEEALRLDSSLADAYLALGTYRYQRSAQAGLLRTLGLVSDRRAEGLEMVKYAMSRGTLGTVAARSTLAWAYLDQGRLTEALELIHQLRKQFPDSRAFLWPLGKAYRLSNRFRDAVESYEALLSLIRRDPRNNHYNEIGCLRALAECYAALGDWRAVQKVCAEADRLSLSPDVSRRKSKDLKELSHIAHQADRNLRPP